MFVFLVCEIVVKTGTESLCIITTYYDTRYGQNYYLYIVWYAHYFVLTLPG